MSYTQFKTYFPIRLFRHSGWGRRSIWVGLLFAGILLFLGLIVLTNHATAGIISELQMQLNEATAINLEIGELVKKEYEIEQAKDMATDSELKLQLNNQHDSILQKIGQLNKLKLGILKAAVELLSSYEPSSISEREAAVHEAERLVVALQLVRDAILMDPDAPNKLVVELGINSLLERTEDRLSRLYKNESGGGRQGGHATADR